MINKRNLVLLLILPLLIIFILIRIPDDQPVVQEIQQVVEEVEVGLGIVKEAPPEKITLDKIFDGIDASSDADDEWSLLVGGDVMIGRTVNYKTLVYKDPNWPYLNLGDIFSKADYTFVNLESPVIENCPVRNDGMIFCGQVNHIEAMAKAGIDGVSLANNHMLNQGKEGLQTTLNYLTQHNIDQVGAPNPTYIEVKNQRIALLGYTDVECYEGVECVNYDKIKSDIAAAKNNSDLIIIMYHWGAEYRDYPTDRQKEIAHLSIDSGADLVLGNHPHWIQPFEMYKDKLIMYSHGNLVFDQMWSQKTREGALVKYIFRGNELVDAEVVPVLIEDYGQPELMEGQAKIEKLDFIKMISENLAKRAY